MIILVIFQPLKGQVLSPEALETAPIFFKKQFFEQTYQVNHIKKKTGHLFRVPILRVPLTIQHSRSSFSQTSALAYLDDIQTSILELSK